MGMYTELLCIAEIKKEHWEVIEQVFNNDCDTSWEDLKLDSAEFKTFITCERCHCIPFMENEFYMPPKFNKGNIVIWCNLKNYGEEIKWFLAVLHQISDKVHCFKSRYEGCDEEWINHLA